MNIVYEYEDSVSDGVIYYFGLNRTHNSEGEIYVYNAHGDVVQLVKDNAVTVCQAIRVLFSDKCTDISKANETVSFTLFSKNMNVGGGIVYDISGELNTGFINMEFVTRSKALSASGWYYYYSDFEKWRSEGRST